MAESQTTPGADAIRRAEAVVDRLCEDPEVWATHGMPGDFKLHKIVVAIAEEMERLLNGSEELSDAG